ncbi:MAG: 3-ketoacyl-ACP reductase [Chloroflexi bacterium]|nr:3-ketoacyl-ACP reductase [Chloroflexota bacterium]
MSSTKNRIALVTGAARGIGRAIAVALARERWNVIINYRGNAQAAEEARAQVQAAGARGIVIQADVANATDRARLVAQTLETFGRIDLLVNNAGIAPRQRVDILETTEASYDEVMATNLRGPFFLTQLVARKMIEHKIGGAKIVNIGSLSSYASSPNRGEYCISKAGVAMMTTLFADRLSEYGIHVYEIRPGVIETDLTSVVKAKYDKMIAEGIFPIRRWGQPEDVARAVVAIARDALPYSTGEVINVDGGFHLRRL